MTPIVAREQLGGAFGEAAAGLRDWLCSGVLQSVGGAFCAWLNLVTGQTAFEYPEITGYALTYLASLGALSSAEIATGERAGTWLARRVGGGNLSARDGWDNGAIYLFDLGMIATGLLSFGRRIGSARMVESGLGLVAYLRQQIAGNPLLSPVPSASPVSKRRAWSAAGRAHLAKLAQPLLLDEENSDCGAAGLIEHVKRLQHDDGRFETGPEAETMLHPHLYAAEGLWIWSSATGDGDALERARAAVDWALGEQLPSGGFPRAAASATPVEQSDVTAQVLRLSLLLGIESPQNDRAATRLTQLAGFRPGPKAIVYQPDAPVAHLNTCATLFGAQALAATAPGAAPLPWHQLV